MTTKSFIKTIGKKGLLADYNTEGKKLQTELTAGNNITIDGNTISSDQVFVATYGTTKYAEVKAAYDAGKLCTVFKDTRYYYVTEIRDEYIKFGSVSANPNIYSLTLTRDNKWSSYNPWLQTHLTFDDEPTAGSKNPVRSGGIKAAIDSEASDRESADTTLQTNIDTVDAKGIVINEINGENVICFE